MKFNIEFFRTEKFLPTKRHRKERLREVRDNVKVDIQELIPNNFPVAFIIDDYCSVFDTPEYDNNKTEYKRFQREIRTYNGELYMAVNVSHGAAISTHYEPLSYIEDKLRDWYTRFSWYEKEESDLFNEKSIILSDNREERIAEIEENAKHYVIYDNIVWVRVNEPMYLINTFGLGHNHGGTGFFIDFHYNPNISKDNYFNALQREEAIAYGKAVAARRGDTESVDSIGEFDNIIVLMPELVKRNPQEEHGEGCSFINMLNSLTESADSVGEAGVLAVAATLANLK